MPGPPSGIAIPYLGPAPNPPSPHEPNTVPPIVAGPTIRDAPPDGRQSYTVQVPTTPLKIAPMRPWRQGVLLYNEDSTNAIRYGESAALISAATSQPAGALLIAGASIILRGSPEVWAVAVAGNPRITIVDEWYAAPPQGQPMGI